jgi:hypothetical protein
MDATNADGTPNKTINEIALSVAMTDFYHDLAAVQTTSIFYVTSAGSAEEMKERAEEMSGILSGIRNPLGYAKCPPGMYWNPETNSCEPIIPD